MNTICPCCGKGSLVNNNSRKFNGVLICNQCTFSELHVNWWVENAKPSKETKEYFDLRNKYSFVMNFVEDKKQQYELEQKMKKAMSLRLPKYVVYVDSSDGFSVKADFSESNLALAYVRTWLGSAFNQVSNNQWVGMYGDVITIEFV